jgi:hypothetical protein
MTPSRAGRAAIGLVALAACAPALDWRETKPDGSGVAMLFPCRPERQERVVRLAGADLPLRLHSCRAAGTTFSLAFADAVDAARVTPLLLDLRAGAAANIGGTPAPRAFALKGATANEHGAQLRTEGRLPDGRPVVEHAAFFVKDLRVYQATVLGESPPADAVDTFFGAIRLSP